MYAYWRSKNIGDLGIMANDYYYNDGKKITPEEAHELKDKSKLIVSDREIK